MQTTVPSATLDRRGKTITTFVAYDAAASLAGLNRGDVLEILTDDFEPFDSDLAAWCAAAGHTMLASEDLPAGRRFLIEKGQAPDGHRSLAMVISVAGLEELLSPLGFALAAALEGLDVHLYFQGPAVRVLSRSFRPRLGGWARPFSRFAAAGLNKAGHIPAREKLGQLRALGASLYVCGPSMQHFKVSKDALVFDDVRVVEYLTFMSVMERADVHLYT